jgi:hypothetical protein
MDALPISETLPGRYRAVLDAVASLERAGCRHDAALIRAEATRAYSRAWTPEAERHLIELLARALRLLEGGGVTSGSRLGRRALRGFAIRRSIN